MELGRREFVCSLLGTGVGLMAAPYLAHGTEITPGGNGASSQKNGSGRNIGFLVYPGMLQLDFTGAYGILAEAPEARMHLVWKDTTPILSCDKLLFTPTTTFASCPDLDVLIVPGGAGIIPLFSNSFVVDFLHRQSRSCRYIASVCTGALVIGAAGLLDGYAATTHWLAQDLLPLLGATPKPERVVVDRNRISCAGVTSGIDMALVLVDLLWGRETAQRIQLVMEYAPEPPFAAGTPASAPPALVHEVRTKTARMQAERLAAVQKVAAAGFGK